MSQQQPTSVHPELPPMAFDTVIGSGGKELFLRRYDNPNAEYVLVLVHGTAGHSEVYHEFAEHYRSTYPAAIWAFDLTGHGHTPGPRGVFTFEDFLEDTRLVAEAAERTGIPVVLHGSSQGGEIAFHAMERTPGIAGAVCMDILLSDEVPMNAAVKAMQSPLVNRLIDAVGDRVHVPLRRVIDFGAAYQEDPDLLGKKLADPFYVWSYGLKSYQSVFTYKPTIPAKSNTTPVLVTCGGNDEILDPAHIRECFERIGGPKDLFVLPGGGHQLMIFETEVYSKVINSWIQERALGGASSWTAPIDEEEQVFYDFLARETKNGQAGGEPQYDYSILDKALTKISNGTIERGVRYFSQSQSVDQWRFTGELVSKIDYAAWDFLHDYLPKKAPSEKPRMAIVGCGAGHSIVGLRQRWPELNNWEIDGFDVDFKAIRAGRRNLEGVPGVRLFVGDVRNPGVFDAEGYDLIYMHGIFDHCTEHRTILESAYNSLRPGGRYMYVTPDRNPYTWASFVTVGPLYVFGMHMSIHDFRRFPRPQELFSLLTDVGFHLVSKKDDPGKPAVAGLEYANRMNPLSVVKSVRNRDLSDVKLEHTQPRSWIGGGYLGEYVGVAEKLAH
ncbi:alpha/beta fold hydrolase [Smaragdicoccus niigatensis]|uniref:alpha/beta fold hydrolase n=1 Tax=Smaragdicoccus niigatensis TaxID=359359 RepID=UPI000ADC498E|nr:alpha/beta fold hydrolase [Smaragdicoccus niigatensis]